MNKQACYWLTIALFINSLSVSAMPTALWHCNVYDSSNNLWSIESHYKRVALNRAFEACKKSSALPASCRPAHPDCEAFINGVSTTPLWQCVALDKMGDSWSSNIYPDRYDAALAAKAYCQAHSSIPDTCYIYVSTCRNLNNL